MLTRDGFTLVVMGFTGWDALGGEVKCIGAFNRMEKLLTERQTNEWKALRAQSRQAWRIETDSIHQFIEYAKDQGSRNAGHYYSNLISVVNKAASINSRNVATGP